MSLSTTALRRPVATISATIALILLGAVSLGRMPVSLLPDVALPVLTVRTVYDGAAPEEVSRFIAEPIEKAVGNTPGLVEMRSVSRNGEGTTILRFGWGTDMAKTVLAVREKLDNARNALPTAAARPTLLTSDPGERPIAVLALTGPGDLRAVARAALDVHARRLEQISGVASVAVVGDPNDEIRVDVDPERMRALGLTSDDVATAIKSANAMAPGGTIRRGQFRFPVRTFTELRDPAEIRDIPVGPMSKRVTMGDIATVTPASADPRTIVRLDGTAAVGLVVYKDAGANTVAVTKELQKTLGLLRTEFPKVQIRLVAAQAQFVQDALSNLSQEIIAGGILSILLILVFLRDWRMSLAIGLMVPLSVLVSLTLLQMFHVTINILSLGGLALAVGLLVDNAIVVAEATGRMRDEGVGYWESARLGTEEVAGPLIAGTLTTVLVFGPIVFVQGLAAALFRDLSISVVLTVTASLIMALTMMPVMMTLGRRGRSGEPAVPVVRHNTPEDHTRITRWGHELAEQYEAGMAWSLRNPGKVFAVSIAVTLFTVLITMRLPREILPQVDEGTAVAEMRLPAGTAIEETIRQTARIEAAAAKLGSRGVYVRVGVATDEEVLSGSEPGSAGTAVFVIPVPDGMDASRFADALRKAVPDLAAGSLSLDLAGQSEFGSLIGREGRSVKVEISAPRREMAALAADQVRTALARITTLADVQDAYAGTQPVVEVTLLRERIAQRNISIGAVANALKGALGGVPAGDLRETDRRTPIQIRYAGVANESIDAAMATTVQGVPLAQLVSLRETRAPIEVVRIGQRPVSVVEGAVERGGTAKAAADVEAAMQRLTLDPAVEWSVTGADTEQRKTTRELGIVALLSIALMFLVLAGEFASFTTPLLVMTTVPLAGAGGILALWITGQSINAVSLIGIVVMIGMADNEAVVKLDAIRRFRELGHPIDEAILLGGRQRLRAIAMTSLTTITGVLPLVFNWGSGGALYQPLAAGIIGGSVSALLVTFFLLPTAYAVIERRHERRALAAAALSEASG
ncbi:MAG: efflux RND transporter permease subunit [Gemmatimonadota bacterium]